MMKYIETNHYNEFIKYEIDGKEHTADLYNVTDTGYGVTGYFEHDDKEYIVEKKLYLNEETQGTELSIGIKRVLRLKRIGVDSWNRTVYESPSGGIYKRYIGETVYTSDRFDGEPDYPVNQDKHKIIFK